MVVQMPQNPFKLCGERPFLQKIDFEVGFHFPKYCKERGLGGGASLSDYSETWHLLVDCQSGPLPISTHCVMVVIGTSAQLPMVQTLQPSSMGLCGC